VTVPVLCVSCLQPKWSCADIDPNTPGCQPFICPPEDGYLVNQNNSFAGNPSLEVCCVVGGPCGSMGFNYVQAHGFEWFCLRLRCMAAFMVA
jgi:hypothetical protein